MILGNILQLTKYICIASNIFRSLSSLC